MESISRISTMLDTSTLFWNARKASLGANDMASSRLDIGSGTVSWDGSELVCSIDHTRSANESNQETAGQSGRSRDSRGLTEGHKRTILEANPQIKPELILTI